MKNRTLALVALAAFLMAPLFAQDNSQPTSNPAPQAQSAPSNPSQAPATSADKTQPHQPLTLERHEGFWGKINPFARKKYVQRQLQPVANRVNELDQLTAENARMIKDVDSRAQEGIRVASLKANEADQHAVEAGQRADQANQTAQQASSNLGHVSTAVNSLDQYKPVTDVEIHFRSGQTVLSRKAKDALDQLADQLTNQHGTILQVQGFSSGNRQASIANSQAMAQSVVRYMVLEHNVPVWRIYTVGMGNAPITVDGKTQRIRGGRVEVALLKNGVGDLQQDTTAAPANAGGMNGAMAQPASNSAAPMAPAAPATNMNSQPAPAPANQPDQPPAPENPR